MSQLSVLVMVKTSFARINDLASAFLASVRFCAYGRGSGKPPSGLAKNYLKSLGYVEAKPPRAYLKRGDEIKKCPRLLQHSIAGGHRHTEQACERGDLL